MALSAAKKLERKRKWVVESTDASNRYGEILSVHDTPAEAKRKAGSHVFRRARRETIEEAKERLARRERERAAFDSLRAITACDEE